MFGVGILDVVEESCLKRFIRLTYGLRGFLYFSSFAQLRPRAAEVPARGHRIAELEQEQDGMR